MGTNTKKFGDEKGICAFCQAEVAAGCLVCLQCQAVRQRREVANESVAAGIGQTIVWLVIICLVAPFVAFVSFVLVGKLCMVVGIHPGAAVLVGIGVYIWCVLTLTPGVPPRIEYVWHRAGLTVVERVEPAQRTEATTAR